MGFSIISDIIDKELANKKDALSETIKNNLSHWLVNIVKNDEELINKKGFKIPEIPSVEIKDYIEKPNELNFNIKTNLSKEIFNYSSQILDLNKFGIYLSIRKEEEKNKK
jgi:hypothetical protein